MYSDDTTAIQQWVAQAQAESEQISLADWKQLWASWADINPEG
jgi:hypothetical protein